MLELKTILVVEDDVDIREAVTELLEGAGFKVRAAQNGLDALARLRQLPRPSVILLDLLMPIMNGWEFRRAQLRDGSVRNIPTVLATASGVSDATLHADFEGVTIMPKPWIPGELLAVLRRLAELP